MSNPINVLERISSALGRKDEKPNQELAKDILDIKDKIAIAELIKNLYNSDKKIQNDCIKVIYEIGFINPSLIVEYFDVFLKLLNSKNNRIQWGAMIAINCIVNLKPKLSYINLSRIISAGEKGSVITRDHALNIIISISKIEAYKEDGFSLLMEQLLKSPTNQLPMYAERALPLITDKNKDIFIKTLNMRIGEYDNDNKLKRIQKIIKKLA